MIIEPTTERPSVAAPDSTASMDDLYNRGRLFPLYLCPFESFLRADSHDDYPMAFIVVMRFFGQLKENEFLTVHPRRIGSTSNPQVHDRPGQAESPQLDLSAGSAGRCRLA